MTKQELTTLLRSVGVSENTVTAMENAFDLGVEHGREFYSQLFLDPENQPTQFGTATQEYRAKEIQEEREACANLAEIIDPVWESIADAIRARGEM